MSAGKNAPRELRRSLQRAAAIAIGHLLQAALGPAEWSVVDQPRDIDFGAWTLFGIRLTNTVERVDPRGKKYYWIGGGEPEWECEEGTDFDAVGKNLVSITPLHLDLTDYASFERIRMAERLEYGPTTAHEGQR